MICSCSNRVNVDQHSTTIQLTTCEPSIEVIADHQHLRPLACTYPIGPPPQPSGPQPLYPPGPIGGGGGCSPWWGGEGGWNGGEVIHGDGGWGCIPWWMWLLVVLALLLLLCLPLCLLCGCLLRRRRSKRAVAPASTAASPMPYRVYTVDGAAQTTPEVKAARPRPSIGLQEEYRAANNVRAAESHAALDLHRPAPPPSYSTARAPSRKYEPQFYDGDYYEEDSEASCFNEQVSYTSLQVFLHQ